MKLQVTKRILIAKAKQEVDGLRDILERINREENAGFISQQRSVNGDGPYVSFLSNITLLEQHLEQSLQAVTTLLDESMDLEVQGLIARIEEDAKKKLPMGNLRYAIRFVFEDVLGIPQTDLFYERFLTWPTWEKEQVDAFIVAMDERLLTATDPYYLDIFRAMHAIICKVCGLNFPLSPDPRIVLVNLLVSRVKDRKALYEFLVDLAQRYEVI